MKSMAATMGGSITESDSEATTLFAPTVRYASTNESQVDPCMDWRAELWLRQLDIVDAPDVLGGYADFLTIRLGEDSIADMLDSLSQDAENFAGLFDGKYVADSVQDQFRSLSARSSSCSPCSSRNPCEATTSGHGWPRR